MLGLLKKRFPDFEVVELDDDFWDIVNPNGKSNIGVYLEKLYSLVRGELILPARNEYVIHFDSQHRHFDDLEKAFEYIESIMNEEIAAIEFFLNGEANLVGEIDTSKLSGLTFETICEEFRYGKDYIAARTFTVRSFCGTFDMNGRFEYADGRYILIAE